MSTEKILLILFILLPFLTFAQIEITNWDELQAIQKNLKADYILMNDLGPKTKGFRNYQSGKGFRPLGRDATIGVPGDNTFLGTFDGNNHVISGLYINRPEEDFVGLFGSIFKGTVRNLGLEKVNISGNKYVGGIAGLMTDAHRYRFVVTNCYVTGKISGLDVAVGGLVGRLYDAKINYCYSTADVCGKQSVGGLVGGFSFSELVNCYSTGHIQGEDYIGGLIGTASATSHKRLTIKNSFFKGKVDERCNFKAGLANTKAMQYLNVTNSFFQDINGSNDVGALKEATDFYYDTATYMYKKWPTGIWRFKKGKLPQLSRFKNRNKKEQAHQFCTPGETVINTIPPSDNNIDITNFETNQLFELEHLHFESSKFDLTEASHKELDKLAAFLLQNNELRLVINGHTDNVGDAEANLILSNDRAQEVSRYLTQKGIAKDRMWTKGFGSTKSIADNNTEEGRQKNRRVTFMLIE